MSKNTNSNIHKAASLMVSSIISLFHSSTEKCSIGCELELVETNLYGGRLAGDFVNHTVTACLIAPSPCLSVLLHTSLYNPLCPLCGAFWNSRVLFEFLFLLQGFNVTGRFFLYHWMRCEYLHLFFNSTGKPFSTLDKLPMASLLQYWKDFQYC